MYEVTPSAIYWMGTYACVTHRKWKIVRLKLYFQVCTMHATPITEYAHRIHSTVLT